MTDLLYEFWVAYHILEGSIYRSDQRRRELRDVRTYHRSEGIELDKSIFCSRRMKKA
jgi:hypothetical protein